jgi:hypothetical protein
MCVIAAVTAFIVFSVAAPSGRQTDHVRLEPLVNAVTLQANDVTVKDWMSLLADAAGIKIVFAEEVSENAKGMRVTAHFRMVPPKAVVEFILASAGALTFRTIDSKTVEIVNKRRSQ